MKTTIINLTILMFMIAGLIGFSHVAPLLMAGMTYDDFKTEKSADTIDDLKAEAEDKGLSMGVKNWNMQWQLIKEKEAAAKQTKIDDLNLPDNYIVEYQGIEDLGTEKDPAEYDVYRVLKPVKDDSGIAEK